MGSRDPKLGSCDPFFENRPVRVADLSGSVRIKRNKKITAVRLKPRLLVDPFRDIILVEDIIIGSPAGGDILAGNDI
jgi:hypothetical protein